MKIQKNAELILLVKRHFELNCVGLEKKQRIEKLMSILKASNRDVRRAIHNLRFLNVAIIPDMKKGGYFLARKHNAVDFPHIVAFRKSEKKRAINSWVGYKVTNQFLPKGQLDLSFEIAVDDFMKRCKRWCDE